MQECTVPTEEAAALCLSLARFLFNGLNYHGLSARARTLSLPTAPILLRSACLPLVRRPPLAFPALSSGPCLRPSSGYLLGFYLWSRSQCSRPIWTGARSNFPIIVSHLGGTKLSPRAVDRRAGRPGSRERSKALRVIRSGIIFRRVLFQFINKAS